MDYLFSRQTKFAIKFVLKATTIVVVDDETTFSCEHCPLETQILSNALPREIYQHNDLSVIGPSAVQINIYTVTLVLSSHPRRMAC